MGLKNKLSSLLEFTDKIETFVDKRGLTRWFIERSNLAFFYGTFLFLYEIAFLRHLVPVVHPFLIAWAFFMVAYDICVRKIWRTVPRKNILFLFVLSALVTAFLTLKAGVMGNVKAWIMIAIPLFVFYPVCMDTDIKNRKKALIKSMLGASTVYFIAAIIALVTYLLHISYQVVLFDDQMTFGYRYYIPGDTSSGILLYGVYEDTNHSAAYALVFTAISAIIYMSCKKGLFENPKVNSALKVFAIANIVAQICYFPMANSRGAWLALIISLTIVSFLYLCFTKLRHIDMKKRIIKSLALTIAAVLVVSIGILGVRTAISGTANIIFSITDKFPSDDIDSQDPNSTDKKPSNTNKPTLDSFDKTDEYMGGGRLYIWQDTFSLVKKMPIFGNGPGNNEYFAKKYDVAEYTLAKGKHVHNSYLDLLLNYGAVGFLIMMAFLVLCAKDVFRKVLIDGKNRDVSYYLVAFSVLVVAITSFFLSSVFINTTAVSFIMFISLGYLVSEKQIKSNKIISEA